MIGDVALMKTPQEWWQSMVIPNNKTIAVATIPDIERIQKDAFDAGRVAGLRVAAVQDRAHASLHSNRDFIDLLECCAKEHESTQPNDTPCSKKGEM